MPPQGGGVGRSVWGAGAFRYADTVNHAVLSPALRLSLSGNSVWLREVRMTPNGHKTNSGAFLLYQLSKAGAPFPSVLCLGRCWVRPQETPVSTRKAKGKPLPLCSQGQCGCQAPTPVARTAGAPRLALCAGGGSR